MRTRILFILSFSALFFLSHAALAQWNPRPGWQDSYSVDGVCYCSSSNYDHGLDTKTADTPVGTLNVVTICEDIKNTLGEGPVSGRIPYNDIQCGNGPANDAADEAGCPGRVDIGSAGCDDIGPSWDLEAVYGPWENGNVETESGEFRLVKRNASSFALDGGSGGVSGRSVELWDNINHVNLTWTEIDRGDGYYSFQKFGTNVCIDGGDGGANRQDVILMECSASDQNQHWKKINVGGNYYVLQKRNAPNYAIDGNHGGAINQNVYLWKINMANQNQQWRFDAQ